MIVYPAMAAYRYSHEMPGIILQLAFAPGLVMYLRGATATVALTERVLTQISHSQLSVYAVALLLPRASLS
jgi:hypothetical protein